MTIGESHAEPAASETDAASAAGWREALRRAAEVESTPWRPAWSRSAVVLGSAGIVLGLTSRVLRVAAPAALDGGWLVSTGTVTLVVLAVALVVLTPWANWRSGSSVVRSLTRAERRELRHELTGRAPLLTEHVAVLSGLARQQRMALIGAVASAGIWSLISSTWISGPGFDWRTIFDAGFMLLVIVYVVSAAVPVIRQRPIPPRWG